MPGIKANTDTSNDRQVAMGKVFRASSFGLVEADSKSELNDVINNANETENTRKRRSLRRERSLNNHGSRGPMNSNGSTEVAVDFIMPNHKTVSSDNGRYNVDGQIQTGNGTAIGAAIRLNDITDCNDYIKTTEIKPRLSRGLISVNSSENDGYESSHCTPSKRNSRHPDSYDTEKKKENLLDIEAQISDFAYCSPKRRQHVYKEGHTPPVYSSHKRRRNKETYLDDCAITTAKTNGRSMIGKQQNYENIGQNGGREYVAMKGKLTHGSFILHDIGEKGSV